MPKYSGYVKDAAIGAAKGAVKGLKSNLKSKYMWDKDMKKAKKKKKAYLKNLDEASKADH